MDIHDRRNTGGTSARLAKLLIGLAINNGTRTTLIVGVIGLALVSSGCSFSIGFNIKNLSGKSIVISYSSAPAQPAVPRLVGSESGEKYAPIPENRIAINRENKSVEFTLLANEGVELLHVSARSDNDYEKDFHLRNLRIVTEDGALSLEGRNVFQGFRPVKRSWFGFGPDVVGFVLEYR